MKRTAEKIKYRDGRYVREDEKSALPVGRPKGGGGRVMFTQVQIDALPESGSVRAIARALGIRQTSIQQWIHEARERLRAKQQENGRYVIQKEKLVNWLIKTKRFKKEEGN